MRCSSKLLGKMKPLDCVFGRRLGFPGANWPVPRYRAPNGESSVGGSRAAPARPRLRCGSLFFDARSSRSKHGVVGRPCGVSVLVGEVLCELRTKEQDLRRVINPEHDHDQRTGRPISECGSETAEQIADEIIAEHEEQ